jgi:uncharacterized coiled-coil protein SlyX
MVRSAKQCSGRSRAAADNAQLEEDLEEIERLEEVSNALTSALSVSESAFEEVSNRIAEMSLLHQKNRETLKRLGQELKTRMDVVRKNQDSLQLESLNSSPNRSSPKRNRASESPREEQPSVNVDTMSPADTSALQVQFLAIFLYAIQADG